ncbi:MAG: hypothetical protein JW795_00125 [Chitinivibrionales bacterium]|nr:hypothetical protein [Chitinivibrionales bacterium]
MKRVVLIMGLLFCFSQIQSQVKRDSIDYGDNTMQWRVINTDGAVVAFAKAGNTLWYSTAATVGKVDMKSYVKTVVPKLGDRSSGGVTAIGDDGAGGVWFGSEGGVLYNKSEKYTAFTKDNGLSDNSIKVICGSNGIVWIGTGNGVSRYANGTWTKYTTDNGLSGNTITGMVIDSKDGVWCATNKGISVFSGGQWKKYDSKSGLSSDDVHAIGYDPRKNEIWAAAGEMDVLSFNGKSWSTYMDIYSGITCIMTDTQSRIWFGSPTGVIKYNGFEWITDQSKIGLPESQIHAMFRDKNGDMFFALDNGLLHMKNPYPF